MKNIKTPEEILEINFYRPKDTLQHYDNIVTCMEDYKNQFNMKTIAESIWSNGKYVIPMAEVSHIEHDQRKDYKKCAYVIFKHSKFANEGDVTFSPNVWLDETETESFKKDWCYYRREFEDLLWFWKNQQSA